MKAYLYLLNTLADWEIGFITAELNSNRYLDKTKPTVPLIIIGNTSDSVRTMGGISITPDECMDSIKFNEGDLLILPGADTWMNENNHKIMAIVSNIIERKVIIKPGKPPALLGDTKSLTFAGIN